MSGSRQPAIAALEARLGWTFRDRDLLERALTHAGAASGGRKLQDNQRLEFLGDRVLGLLTAERLSEALPDDDEGQLSMRLHTLVEKSACARAARAIGLGAALRLSPGDVKLGNRDSDSILGDACEALLGALYLDAGLERTREIWRTMWGEQFDSRPSQGATHPKSKLQTLTLARVGALPMYSVVERTGPDHAPRFTVEVAVVGLDPVRAEGGSRQEAEKAAAAAMLAREGA